MKKVIIIVGKARSGSTLLNLMLGNDQRGLAVGELISLMRPNHSRHLLKDRTCFCSKPDCHFWKEMSRDGEEHVYSNIFEKFPKLDFIVDSSKRPLWLKDQIRYSKEGDYKVIPVICYKTPLEYAYSREKRNHLNGWKKAWIKRHLVLFHLLDDFVTVKYQELALNPAEKLKTLCNELDISYFKDKEKFWMGDNSHSLFGSGSVKSSNRLIYYDQQYDKDKLNNLKNKLDLNNRLLNNILQVLDAFEVKEKSNASNAIYSLKNKLGRHPTLSQFVYRLHATPYYMINKLTSMFLKSLLKIAHKKEMNWLKSN